MGMVGRIQQSTAGLADLWHFDNRWELIARRLLFRRTGMLTYRKGAMEIIVDHHGGDEAGTRACLTSPMYRDLLPALGLAPSLTVFDIGANGGGFPLMLEDAGYHVAKLGAVEMNPRTYGRMQVNMLQNLTAETTLLNAAICGEATQLSVEFGRGSTGESISGTRGASSHGDKRAATIPGITFDAAFDRCFGADGVVDLCKMDIEGAEYAIFRSPDHRRLSRCRALLIEIHDVPGERPAAVTEAIAAAGLVPLAGRASSHEDVSCFVNPALAR